MPRVKNEAENSLDYQYKTFIVQHPINENTAKNNYMVEWIRCAKEVKTNRKNHKTNDARKFIITKRKNRWKDKDKSNEEEIESKDEYFLDSS